MEILLIYEKNFKYLKFLYSNRGKVFEIFEFYLSHLKFLNYLITIDNCLLIYVSCNYLLSL